MVKVPISINRNITQAYIGLTNDLTRPDAPHQRIDVSDNYPEYSAPGTRYANSGQPCVVASYNAENLTWEMTPDGCDQSFHSVCQVPKRECISNTCSAPELYMILQYTCL